MIGRRSFLIAGATSAATLAGGAAWFSTAWAQNAPQLGTPTLPEPGFRRLRMGDVEIIALNDGVARRPLGEEFVKNAPLAEVRATLAAQGLPTDYIDIPFNPFVVVAGNRRILMDTGFADNGGATTGRLQASMQAAGLKPDDIDTVLITHFHGDHINGLRNKAGALVYPKAKVMVPAPEYAFWMDDARMNAAPEAMRGAFGAVRRVFGGMSADQLVRFEPGSDVVPGLVGSVAAFGHTPGHTLFKVSAGNRNFVYVADITNVPSLFARNPDWAVAFDMDAEAARLSRRKVFDMVVADKAMVGGYHFPFPAMGEMQAMGKGYDFKPLQA